MGKENKKPFCSKFIDEDKFSNNLSLRVRRCYCQFYFAFAMLTLWISFFSVLNGFELTKNISSVVFLGIDIGLLFISIYLLYKIYQFENTYKIFKKRNTLVLLSLPFYLLMIASCVMAFLTTHVLEDEITIISVGFNGGYLFLIYLPLFLGYLIFIYYAFFGHFGKNSYSPKAREIELK